MGPLQHESQQSRIIRISTSSFLLNMNRNKTAGLLRGTHSETTVMLDATTTRPFHISLICSIIILIIIIIIITITITIFGLFSVY
jgi:hypothetical protein